MSRVAAAGTTVAVVLTLGVSAGFWLFTHWGRPVAASAAHSELLPPVPAHAPRDPIVSWNAMRTTQMEARLAALEARTEVKSVETELEDERAVPRVVPSASEVEQAHRAAIERHRSEPLNRRWASTTSAAFSTDYSSVKDTTFAVKEVDCRSTTCALEFEWPSHEAAVAEWKRTLIQPTQANCGRRIVVPQADPGQTGPVRATLIADCSTWVEQGSPLASQSSLP